jgi:hypothetical protein
VYDDRMARPLVAAGDYAGAIEDTRVVAITADRAVHLVVTALVRDLSGRTDRAIVTGYRACLAR